jgi:hypothetical protein
MAPEQAVTHGILGTFVASGFELEQALGSSSKALLHPSMLSQW